MADLDYPDQPTHRFLVDFVPGQRLRVVQEVAQKPAQLPHRLRGAIEPADDGHAFERFWFKHDQSQHIERLLRVPAMLGMIEADEEDTVRYRGTRFLDCGGDSWQAMFHATTSWLGRAKLLS